MRKRIIAVAILLLLACFTGWLISEASGPEVLPEGSLMPKIKYTCKNGTDVLKHDSTKETMVIFFNSECSHCKYELGELNNNIEKFENVRIYFFTTEKDFFQKPVVDRWKNLYTAPNIYFGIVDKDSYEKKFGSMVTPSIFLFSTSSKLTKKIYGEMKIERLLEDLKI
ncbi:MAG: peroxiredoxin family protein [Ignavibacteriaceae bacterium]